MSIHIYKEHGEFEVWTDCEASSEKDGRCLASGSTRQLAMMAAMKELEDDLRELRSFAWSNPNT
jgi:hypothetical protein